MWKAAQIVRVPAQQMVSPDLSQHFLRNLAPVFFVKVNLPPVIQPQVDQGIVLDCLVFVPGVICTADVCLSQGWCHNGRVCGKTSSNNS